MKTSIFLNFLSFSNSEDNGTLVAQMFVQTYYSVRLFHLAVNLQAVAQITPEKMLVVSGDLYKPPGESFLRSGH
jgi:hypothetical protein